MTICFTIQLITVFFLIYSKGISAQECDPSDCVHPRSCPASFDKAKTVLDSHSVDTINKFRDFLFTIRCNNTEPNHICCSKMSLWDPESQLKNYSIENHPNLRLLPGSCGPVKWSRILLPIEQNYPWLVLIAYNNNFHSMGTLINDRYVLTSAQCVKNKDIQGVRLGESDIHICLRMPWSGDCGDIHVQDVPVETVIIHDGYNYRSHENDIALLRLADAADFLRVNIAPICLPKTLSLLEQDITEATVEVSDWNLEERDFERSKEPLISRCKVRRPGEIDCRENRDFRCNGDPGGPLMVSSNIGEARAYVQYGVIVDAPLRCFTDRPRKYIEVTKYMEWILNSIKP